MNLLAAVAIGLLVLFYFVLPFDLIPDFAGLPGRLDDLLVLVGAYYWYRRTFRLPGSPRAQRHTPSHGHAHARRTGDADRDWDAYRVLGVSHGASAVEITQAYRDKMKLYHPDRVADLGEELQRVAHEKTVEIQRAYSEIGRG